METSAKNVPPPATKRSRHVPIAREGARMRVQTHNVSLPSPPSEPTVEAVAENAVAADEMLGGATRPPTPPCESINEQEDASSNSFTPPPAARCDNIGDDDEDDARSRDSDDDAGSLVDFIVDGDGSDDENENDKVDTSETTGDEVDQLMDSLLPDERACVHALLTSPSSTGRRRSTRVSRAPQRFVEQYADDIAKVLLEDVPEDELDAVFNSDNDEQVNADDKNDENSSSEDEDYDDDNGDDDDDDEDYDDDGSDGDCDDGDDGGDDEDEGGGGGDDDKSQRSAKRTRSA